ncbi:glucosamine-6-phosphate deaminase [Clostridium hydrogeniformans]|uniref:glucosamine-6-phosphate deaminase n=1 Tax=Clostridium hydrogeniformans TaxID=349933 RepID=UPI0004822606|nr:glucosamine-6-phosphate deaminase [Clostridium hydrogeniformans]
MNINVYENYELMSEKVAEYIIDTVNKNPEALLCLAGGDTPLKAYEYLVDAYNNKRVDFSRCKFVGLDEWVGLGNETEGSCIEMLNKHLYSKISLREKQLCFFDGLSKDLEEECKRVDKFIFDNKGIDLILLGVGMNGHLGFNEPNVNPDLYCTVVDLDTVTTKVGVKYFNEEVELKKGITVGMKHIFSSNVKIIMANGERKSDIIKMVVEGERTREIPASLLSNEESLEIFLDNGAASKLTNYKISK